MEKLIILQGITLEQLLNQIELIVEEKINNVVEQLKPKIPPKYISRKEVANIWRLGKTWIN